MAVLLWHRQKIKKGIGLTSSLRSGICGAVEQEALLNCQASKAKNCQIEIRQLDAQYKYYMYQ